MKPLRPSQHEAVTFALRVLPAGAIISIVSGLVIFQFTLDGQTWNGQMTRTDRGRPTD